MSPLVCAVYDQKLIEAVAVPQNPIFAAAIQFARTEGIFPAPEPSHAIRVAIDEAIRCRERGERKTIAFVLCGHGHFDLASYERYLTGQLEDFALPQSAIDEVLSLVPKVELRSLEPQGSGKGKESTGQRVKSSTRVSQLTS